MKYLINIFFLFISVLYSFGFTTYKGVCEYENTDVCSHCIVPSENNHSCCQKSDNDNKEISTYHSNINLSKCDRDCCSEIDQLFLLNEFTLDNSDNQTDYICFHWNHFSNIGEFSIKTLNVLHIYHSFKSKALKVFYHKPDRFTIILKKQSWII